MNVVAEFRDRAALRPVAFVEIDKHEILLRRVPIWGTTVNVLEIYERGDVAKGRKAWATHDLAKFGAAAANDIERRIRDRLVQEGILAGTEDYSVLPFAARSLRPDFCDPYAATPFRVYGKLHGLFGGK